MVRFLVATFQSVDNHPPQLDAGRINDFSGPSRICPDAIADLHHQQQQVDMPRNNTGVGHRQQRRSVDQHEIKLFPEVFEDRGVSS